MRIIAEQQAQMQDLQNVLLLEQLKKEQIELEAAKLTQMIANPTHPDMNQ